MKEAFKPTIGLAFPRFKDNDKKLTQGRFILEIAREYMIPAFLKIRRKDTPDEEKVKLGAIWANGIREHIIAAEDPISSAKLSLELYITQPKVEKRAKNSIRKIVKKHGGTKKDARVLSERLIRLTKIFQARREVPEDPAIVDELSEKKVIFERKPDKCSSRRMNLAANF